MRSLRHKKSFKEMVRLEKLIEVFGDLARVEIVDEVHHRGATFPLYTLELGSENPEDPVIGYFAGVHGLERIGSEVVLAFMESICSLVKWDESFKKRLKHSRMLFMPIVNPVGIWQKTRSNGNGVDLMRNSPSEGSNERTKFFSGHRFSPRLPWYRGKEGDPMELEAQALCKVVKEKLFCSKLSMAIDVHSGFGARDRFWFPYSRHNEIFPHVQHVMALKDLIDKTMPYHIYIIEPTSYQYTILGDLWDHMVDEYFKENAGTDAKDKMFLPWTLEMGSWGWLRKNPVQLLNRTGWFNPLIPHRYQRIMRRHMPLFDFLHRSVLFPKPWLRINQSDRQRFEANAQEKWYGN